MAVICFVSFEFHPTTAGGCGVLIRHATDLLLADGHEVVLLLDIPEHEFRRFVDHDRLGLTRPEGCRAYRVDEELRETFPFTTQEIPCVFQLNSLRFAYALDQVLAHERPDVVEFFDYCGPAYYSLARRLFQPDGEGPALAVRLHGTIQVLDRFGGGSRVDRDRPLIYALEERALELAETILAPSYGYYERYYRPLYQVEPRRVAVSTPPKQTLARVRRRPSAFGPFRITFVGKLFHMKGVDQLVQAAVRLLETRPDLDCTVELIGMDDDWTSLGVTYGSYLRTLIPQRLKGHFSFAGQLSHDEIATRLNDTLFAVFPNRVESFCYAAHELYDAGVPIIVNGIPAFADFFVHERNALVYDGTTEGLLHAMERMIDDSVLRERLCRPYAVAESPLGDFYDRPRASRALVRDTGQRAHPVVVVLDFVNQNSLALESLRRQTQSEFDVVCLIGREHARDGDTFWWLCRGWGVCDALGASLEGATLTTRDALLVLSNDDQLGPTWMARATLALSRRAELSFAGTWLRRDGRVVPSLLDLAPERHPFDHGSTLTRVLIRTEPGQSLGEVFDPTVGALGEIAYLWDALSRWGPGSLLPEGLVEVADADAPADPEGLRGMLLRGGSAHLERLAMLTASLFEEVLVLKKTRELREKAPEGDAGLTVEDKLRVARSLGGRTLARIVAGKLTGRVRPRRDAPS